MNFEEASREYSRLKSQKTAGQMTQLQFESAVSALQVQTADGNIWQMRASDGVWMRWNGSQWELAQSDSIPSSSQPKQTRSRRGTCLIPCGIGLVIFVCMLVVLGGGGYYMISTGQFSYIQISNMIGPGTGEISIVNLDDGKIRASITRLDAPEGGTENAGDQSLEALDIGGFGALEAGRYLLEIQATNGGKCYLDINRGDEYQFVIVPEGVAVTLAGNTVQSADEIEMKTSSLCRR